MSYERAWVVGVFGRALLKRDPKTDSLLARKSVVKIELRNQRAALIDDFRVPEPVIAQGA